MYDEDFLRDFKIESGKDRFLYFNYRQFSTSTKLIAFVLFIWRCDCLCREEKLLHEEKKEGKEQDEEALRRRDETVLRRSWHEHRRNASRRHSNRESSRDDVNVRIRRNETARKRVFSL